MKCVHDQVIISLPAKVGARKWGTEVKDTSSCFVKVRLLEFKSEPEPNDYVP